MRVYIVSTYEDIYGAFSTLEKAKSYVSYLVKEDGDLAKPYYSVDSFELDKGLDAMVSSAIVFTSSFFS